MKQMKTKLFILITMISVGLITGCYDMTDDLKNEDKKTGTVIVKITDAPFPAEMVAEANVTIDWIKLLKQDEDDGNDSLSTVMIDLENDITINLLALSNGVTEILSESDAPAGTYNQIRLHIKDAGIMLKDSTIFDLKVPSGDASGLKIKIKPALEIGANMVSEVLLDFDVSRSFVLRGNMKHGYDKVVGFIFKPVVRAVASAVTAEIYGTVTDTTDAILKNALLTLLSGTDTVTTALTDSTGLYRMIGILPGQYSLACEKDGYDSQTKENLEINNGESIEQNFELIKKETTGDN
jgi:hypothetical protein